MKKYEQMALWVDRLTCPELKNLKKIIKGVEIKRQERRLEHEKKIQDEQR